MKYGTILQIVVHVFLGGYFSDSVNATCTVNLFFPTYVKFSNNFLASNCYTASTLKLYLT